MTSMTSWMVAAVFVCASGAWAADIEMVTVGDPRNPNDTHGDGYGGVDYVYNIGMYEVTAGQYTEFLNAVAVTDTYGLYNNMMWSSSYHGCMIERTGSPGSYSYTVAPDWADRPVNYVSWGNAARFANWLHNGQPTGAQDLSTTEDGAYYLNGAISDWALLAVTRQPGATWVIPTEDEWYKAAYYDGSAGLYYDYPTGSDVAPGYVNDSGNLSGTGSPFVEGGTDPGGYATYNGDGGTGDDYGIGPPYFRTEAGEWENSSSPYGTYDQCGNVWEWNEAVNPGGAERVLRGGAYLHAAITVDGRPWLQPSFGYAYLGFRVAAAAAVCGDGMVQFWAEMCDDGNTVDGDGCNAACQDEYCGDGIPQEGLGELCDDGNTISGDGCTADCLIEESIFVDNANCPGPGSGTSVDPYCTIQAAIEAAPPGSIVVVADGTYTGNGNRDLSFMGKSITLRSANGPESCVIDCDASFADLHSAFNFGSGESRTATVDGFTITNGRRTWGAGILCTNGSHPTITNCIITGNNANSHGGGVYCALGSHPMLVNCTIWGNNASDHGGAVACDESSPVIVNCVISGNKAGQNGGAIHCDTSHPTLTNCTVVGNQATGSGGAVQCYSSSSPTLTNSVLWGNTPQEVHVVYGTPVVSHCCISGGWSGAGSDNPSTEPHFVADGVWDDNGTTSTWDDLWVEGDYRLRVGSPCIDAGDNAVDIDLVTPGVQPLPATDAEGSERIQDGDGNGSVIVDIGVREATVGYSVPDGETVTVQAEGGDGALDEGHVVAFTNNSGTGEAQLGVIVTDSTVHEDSGGYAVLDTTLLIDVSQGGTPLPNGAFFMTVVIPFDAADLPGADLLSEALAVDLTWYDSMAGMWVLAVEGNTQPSPGHEPDVIGDRLVGDGPITPGFGDLSSDLGDYGVFWNTTTLRGFAWANIDHASDFAASFPGIRCASDLECVIKRKDVCGWDKCASTTPGFCDEPVPAIYGDVCGTGYTAPPNGAVNLTDVLCTLNAFGGGNLPNCPNADVAAVDAGDCPAGNGIVNLTDILKVLDAFGAPTSPTAAFFCDCPSNP